ncbi:hypothetical protein KCP69_12960 [Salmonella enterica subsp. enterica]|nr:hypothetical protein KCP69_12960 [Salmonella enterica subsp. enterica]
MYRLVLIYHHRRPSPPAPSGTLDSRLIPPLVQRTCVAIVPGDKALRIGGGVMGCGCRGDLGRGMGVSRWRSDSPSVCWIVEVWMIFTTLPDASPAPRRRLKRPLRENDLAESRINSPDRRARYVATSASADQSRRGGNGCRKHR